MNLPKQTWQDKFDEEFKYFSGHEMLQTYEGHDLIKSFIAQILEEEKERLVGEVKEVIASEMDNLELQTNLEFIACDNLAIKCIKKLDSLIKK